MGLITLSESSIGKKKLMKFLKNFMEKKKKIKFFINFFSFLLMKIHTHYLPNVYKKIN